MAAAGSTRIAPLADMAMHPATASAQEAFATHIANVHQAVYAFSDHAVSIIRQQEETTRVEVAKLRQEISRLNERRGSRSPSCSKGANWEAPEEMLPGCARSDASSAITGMEALSVDHDDFVRNLPEAPTSPVTACQPFPPPVEFLAPPAAGAAVMPEERKDEKRTSDKSQVSSVGSASNKKVLSITKQLTNGIAQCLPNSRRNSITGGTSSPIRKVTSVFPDPEELKAKCRDAVYATFDTGPGEMMKTSGWAQAIARSNIFEYATLSVIFLSAIWIAVDVDSNTAEDPRDAKLHFKIMDQFFCTYFLIELLVRFAAYSVKWYALTDSWFLFDGLLVLFTVIDTWVLLVIITVSDGSTDIGTGGIGRLFRVLRLARMARMVRLVRAVPELMVLLKGMAAAARSVILTLILLAIMIYVFAVLLRQLTDGTKLGEKYFSSVGASMGNLLLRGTLPDQADFLIESGDESLLYGIFLLIFVLMGSLTLMNMLIGILVQVVSVVADTEREEIAIATLRSSMSDLMIKHGVDTDGDHCISRSEFEHLLTIPEAIKCMASLGVDVVSLVDYVDFIFEAEGVSKDLSFPEIFDLLQQLRSGNHATVRDIVDLRRFLSNQLQPELPDAVRTSVKESVPGNGSGSPRRISRKSLAASVRKTLGPRYRAKSRS